MVYDLTDHVIYNYPTHKLFAFISANGPEEEYMSAVWLVIPVLSKYIVCSMHH